MLMRFFDFEVFPHWWCCTFGDLHNEKDDVNESIKDTFIVVTSDMPDARERLLSLMKENDVCVVGYNIKYYDLMIANAIYQGFTPEQVKIINDIIIRPDLAWSTKEHLRLQSFAKKRLSGCVYQDLMDDNDGSLKEKEAILGLDIMESEVPFDKEDLTDYDKVDVIKYNKHDVYASMIFYQKVCYNYTQTKLMLGHKFNIPEATCHMATNANLVAKALKAVRCTFADADKVDINLPKKIDTYCKINIPAEVLNYVLTNQSGLHVKLFGNEVDFGNGGIHSTLASNLYVESDDEWILVNVDARSYYPSMLIQFALLSRAVHQPQIFVDIYDERVTIKGKPSNEKTDWDKLLEAALKLILNTTYGASGNKWLDLYDPYMCTSTCRVGQLFLAALACKIYREIPGTKIIQTNTDGILAYVRRKDLDKLKALQAEWTKVSGINMDTDYVSKIWQRDVNNYLLVKEDGSIKKKGGWLNDTYTNKGTVKLSPLTAYICAKAATKFLLDGTDIVETIYAGSKLSDFVMTCKKGPTYRGVIQKFEDGSEQELFKCNRVIATTDTSYGMLYKYKMFKGNLQYTKMPNIPEHCRTMNKDLTSYDFMEIRKKLDYIFYIMRAQDLLDIEWQKLSGLSITRTKSFDYV